MLDIVFSSQFKKDYKKIRKSGQKDMSKLQHVMTILAEEKPLDAKYRNHPLKGELNGYYDCHIEPDWLLIYRIDKNANCLKLARTGSHSELFE
ncbi:MAG TPA: type II toxin-antitoxin system mRNA interferase toxin, RelE/StbE family [Lentisphaeria bacterium]|nr:MAG: hypothetical protein A2X48_03435 [Lentisphaerae bacterium GWF2_49_21]HBC85936.1 type II toxin-antitoxin system mRNA interferase toxin, RelE/StbE family [Lentisphaeria bacterium]